MKFNRLLYNAKVAFLCSIYTMVPWIFKYKQWQCLVVRFGLLTTEEDWGSDLTDVNQVRDVWFLDDNL